MRVCFVCRTTRMCAHREPELLPPAAQRLRMRDAIEEAHSISSREIDKIAAETAPVEQLPKKPVEVVQKPLWTRRA
jgi:hypothetical protein